MDGRRRARAARGAVREQALVLIAILAALAALKLVQTPLPDYYGPDGSTYFHIARHVAEGDGLVTSLSLYHQGLKHLPAPTTIYPLWPLVLGYAGRAIGLERAARVLPELLYLIDLGLLYVLVRRLASAWGSRDGRLVARLPIDVGHVAVLLLGLNGIFVRYSSLPYTEPLALGCTFASLLLLDRAATRGGATAALLAGATAGAAYLARTSMIVVPVAVVAALVLAPPTATAAHDAGGSSRSRTRRLRPAVLATLGTALVVLPWLAHLASFMSRFHPMLLVDVFTVHRETPELAPAVWIVPVRDAHDLWRFVADGLVAAFRIGGPSYFHSFGLLTYAVPLALVCGLASSRVRRAFAASERRTLVVGAALAGVGLAVMAHAAHSESDFARRWAFNHRHGLPYVLLIVSALACLLPLLRADDHAPTHADAAALADRDGGGGFARVLRVVVLAMVVVSLAHVARAAYRELAHPRGRSPTRTERALAAWLAAQPVQPVVISSRPPRLAVVSRAGFHWIGCSDDPEQVRRLFRHAGADYLVVRPADRRCRFMRGLERELELVARFRDGKPVLALYRWRGDGVRAATP